MQAIQPTNLLPLGAAGLSSAAMLAWGAAAAIPILLHFLNRRRQQPVRWAAMQILLQVIEKEARRMRIEQLLLLALRVLVLLLLAVALARPYFHRSDATRTATGSRPPKLWILALDTSYSMGYRTGGTSRFDAAKARAQQLLQAGEPGDAYALVAMSDPARALIGSPTFDRAALLDELQRMNVLDAGGDLAGTLAVIREIAQAANEKESVPTNVHVLLFSDLGRDSWLAVVEGPERATLQELQEKYLVEVEAFADEAASNVAIRSIQPSTSRALAGNSLNVDISVVSSGASLERVPVQLELDGRTVASEYVDLPDGQPRTLRLQVRPRAIGASILSASIPDDSLAADNRRDHVIEVREQYRILLVENEPNDARLLKLALQPASGSSISQGISRRSKLELGTVELSNWDVVIFNDIPTLSPELGGKLERFVREQGSLILMFGPRAVAEAWNANPRLSNALWGFQLTEPTPEADWAIDPLDYRSPVVSPFAGFPDSGLLTTPIFRLWRIQPAEPRQLVVDVATTDGKPLIVRHRVGEGWVASVLSTPQAGLGGEGADAPWNAMASWPSYLPLMQQLLQTVLDTGVERTNVLAGDALQGTVIGSVDRSQVTIIRPDRAESQIATEAMDASGALPWFYGQTEIRGVYRAQTANGKEQPFAVNVNPVESSLESIDMAQLPQSTSVRPALSNTAGTPAPVENDDSISRALLGALLILLVSESLLAWSLGRRIG